MLDLLSFWTAAWVVRDMLSVSGTTLMGTMVFASAYYLAAHLVFPDIPAMFKDLDDHYFRVRRVVLAVMFVLLLVQLGYYASVPQLASKLTDPLSVVLTLLLMALMAAAFVFKSKPVNIAVLGALVTRYMLVYIL